MKVLLVEPDYYTRYPSLGLLKLATFHSLRNDDVVYLRGDSLAPYTPDRIYVTSLFTWTWKPVWRAVHWYREQYPKAEIQLGGIYASLIPDHAKLSGANLLWEGILPHVDHLTPDYSLVPDWKSSILFATRGCPRKCGFCSVPKLEGPPIVSHTSIKANIHPSHKKVVFFDNNILGTPDSQGLLEELVEIGIEADFNQGIDARCLNEENAGLLSKMNMPVIRMAYDYIGIRPWVERAIALLKDRGIRGRRLVFYVLHNYLDSPDDFYERVIDLLSWGVVVYPMRYEPLCTLDKNRYVSPKWTAEELSMVAQARRVMGYGGAFPPYRGLVQKFLNARNFQDAFSMNLPKGRWTVPEPIVEMAMEHEQQSSIKKKDYFPNWRREKDWRRVQQRIS